MDTEDHEDLMVYLNELIAIASKIRYKYEWFMESKYMKLVNDTLTELIILDVEKAGI